ncbi:hypothetical protein D3C87_1657160 [compost metagenome]
MPRNVVTYRVKGKLPSIITTTATQWIDGCDQWPSEASDVEKPPVEISDIEWLIASNEVMPASQKANQPAPVRPM